MLNRFKIITVTHKRIDLKDLKQYVVHTQEDQSLEERLRGVKAGLEMEELMYLSTCNRVLYFFVSDKSMDEILAGGFFRMINPALSDEEAEQAEETAYLLEGMDAIDHLYQVAASIDSLVIGERQILGQLREAYEQCRDWELTGDDLRIALQFAVQAAKAVYSDTRIGDKPVSIVSLAIQKLLHAHVPKTARILMVGAGQTNQLAAKFLSKHGFTNVRVFNRTLNKAQQVAELVNGKACRLKELQAYEGGFDCLFVCTGSTEPIITPTLYHQLLKGETEEKTIIDLAIPHNVAREVTEHFPIRYIEIDGLRNLAKENLAFREQEVIAAKQHLEEHINAFPSHYKQRQLEIAMREVPQEIKEVRSKAMNEVFHKEVSTLDDTTRELVDRMLAYMEKKCIGIPMKAAKQAWAKG